MFSKIIAIMLQNVFIYHISISNWSILILLLNPFIYCPLSYTPRFSYDFLFYIFTIYLFTLTHYYFPFFHNSNFSGFTLTFVLQSCKISCLKFPFIFISSMKAIWLIVCWLILYLFNHFHILLLIHNSI